MRRLDLAPVWTYASLVNGNAPARLQPPGAGHEEQSLMSHEGSHARAVA